MTLHLCSRKKVSFQKEKLELKILVTSFGEYIRCCRLRDDASIFQQNKQSQSVRRKADTFWGVSPWKNLLNRGVTIELTKHSIGRNRLRMRLSEQEVLQNGNRIEVWDQFQKKIYHNKIFWKIFFVNKIIMLNGHDILWFWLVR